MSDHHWLDGDVEQPPPERRAGRRSIKWLRRFGFGALAVVAVGTVLSLAFNALTTPPSVIDPEFGAYVQVGGSAVHYEQWGSGGSAVVLIPGFLEASTLWSAVGPLLGEHHVVYALDLPGHGYTRYRGSMLLHSQAELVDGFVRALHLERPILVGHSLGAAVAGSVALAHSEDVGKVVFADGDGLKLNLGPRWLRSLILRSPFVTSALRIGARWSSIDKWVIRRACGPRCPTPTTTLTAQWVRPLRQRAEERALHDLMVSADYGLTPRQIAAIAVPVAIIWGAADHQGGSLSETIVNLRHPPAHIIPAAGHLSMIADPEAFAQAVES
jgi:pimeloyl-ACP methyl ester carboxylesterase